MAREPLWRRSLRWWGPDLRSDVETELQLHFDLLVERYLAEGRDPAEARALARQRFGDPVSLRDECVRLGERWQKRKERRLMLDSWLQDLRFAWRGFRRAPAATAIVVLTSGLGIGAATAIYAVVHGVLLRPLPFAEPERLHEVTIARDGYAEPFPLSDADFLEWQRQPGPFEQVAAFTGSSFNLTGDGEPEVVLGAWVSARFFSTLGVRPALGRGLDDRDGEPGAPSVVLLSDGLWRRRFAADRGVVGRTIALDGADATVVGVMPPAFAYPWRDVELWRAVAFDPPQRHGPFYLTGLARLRPGATPGEARASLAAVAASIRRQYPEPADWRFAVEPLAESIVGDVRAPLVLLLAAVGLLLLIATTNVANVLLARAASREREMGVREALGAGRGRIVRQLLVESVAVALVGGALGVALAVAATRLLPALAEDLPRLGEIRIDGPVLAAALALSLATGVLFGLAPALRLSRAPASSLRAVGRTVSAHRGQRLAQSALVVVEVALASTLTIGAGLLVRSFAGLFGADPGFRPDGLLTFTLDLPQAAYSEGARVATFYGELMTRLRGLAGVESAGFAVSLPPDRLTVTDGYRIEGQEPAVGESDPIAPIVVVGGDYFQTMGIPLLRGRLFDERDREGAAPVVIVNRELARRHFGDADPVGRRLRHGPERPDWPWLTIVGVVGDVRYEGLDAPVPPAYYLPFSQHPWGGHYVVVRTAGEPEALAGAVREAVWSIDPRQPLGDLRTMEELIAESATAPRFRTTLVGLFALLGSALAAFGVYGVTSYAVAQRAKELGIRLTMGARPADLFRLVLGEGLLLAACGLGLGLAGALAASRLLAGLLVGVEATDAPTFGSVALLLLAVALVAAWRPARRAMRADPMTVLRHE